jgi:hypothetical protein
MVRCHWIKSNHKSAVHVPSLMQKPILYGHNCHCGCQAMQAGEYHLSRRFPDSVIMYGVLTRLDTKKDHIFIVAADNLVVISWQLYNLMHLLYYVECKLHFSIFTQTVDFSIDFEAMTQLSSSTPSKMRTSAFLVFCETKHSRLRMKQSFKLHKQPWPCHMIASNNKGVCFELHVDSITPRISKTRNVLIAATNQNSNLSSMTYTMRIKGRMNTYQERLLRVVFSFHRFIPSLLVYTFLPPAKRWCRYRSYIAYRFINTFLWSRFL